MSFKQLFFVSVALFLIAGCNPFMGNSAIEFLSQFKFDSTNATEVSSGANFELQTNPSNPTHNYKAVVVVGNTFQQEHLETNGKYRVSTTLQNREIYLK